VTPVSAGVGGSDDESPRKGDADGSGNENGSEAPGSDTSTETPAPGDGGNGGDNGGGGIIDIPDPWEFTVGIIKGVVESALNGAKALVDAFSDVIFGVPAPGEMTDPATWVAPTGNPWGAVWKFYWLMASLALVGIVIQAMLVSSESTSDRERRKGFVRCAKYAGMIFGGWFVAVAGLHLGDALTTGLAPSGAEFFEGPENITKLGLGIIVGAGLLILQTGTAIIAIGVVLTERVILIATVAFWPIWWMFKARKGGFSGSVAGIGLSAYVGVIGAKILQTGIARLLFMLSWTDSISGGVSAILTTSIGLLVTFAGIPLVVGRNFVPEAMTILGSPAVEVADDLAQQNQQKAMSVAQDHAQSARASAPSREDLRNAVPSPTWSRGSAESASAATSVPDGYSPSPEPGANSAPPSSTSSADSGSKRTKMRLDGRLRDHRR
jgi:hypothetical protein